MDLSQIPILSIVAYVPILGALAIVFLIPKEKTGTIKAFATFVAVIDFAVSLPLWWAFDRGRDGYQFVEQASWIPSLGVDYHFGIDGISLVRSC
jgi:NADH-quinone oxidoreductase subunit M